VRGRKSGRASKGELRLAEHPLHRAARLAEIHLAGMALLQRATIFAKTE
jgi:hypothetical protein